MHSWGVKQTNIKEMYYLTAINFAKWAIALNTKYRGVSFGEHKGTKPISDGFVWYYLKIVFIQRDHEHFLLKQDKNKKYWFGKVRMKTLIDLK